MQKKPPRVGLMILFVAIGAGTVGYILGRFQSDPAVPARPPVKEAVEFLWEEPSNPYEENGVANPGDEEPAEAVAAVEPDPETRGLPPSKLIESLRATADSPRSQQILVGMVADAARLGGPVLADVRELLASGEDIKFASFKGKPGQYPSLRTALLAAAEATGDPAAVELIAEVAQTTESPVEVVYSAHLLDRLDALDAPTAHRTLESLTGDLSADERKVMGSIVGRVVPAAAKADPEFAENFLLGQIHAKGGKERANPRYVIPALDGLPAERAQDVVMNALLTGEVDVKVQRALAGRAAQRRELGMLSELRRAIETNSVSPKVSSSIAHSAMSNRSYSRYAKKARHLLRKGDIAQARRVAETFHERLLEASRTVDAARNSGARVNKKVDTIGRLHRQTLDDIRASIRKAVEKKRKQEKKAAAAGN